VSLFTQHCNNLVCYNNLLDDRTRSKIGSFRMSSRKMFSEDTVKVYIKTPHQEQTKYCVITHKNCFIQLSQRNEKDVAYTA